MGALPDLDRDRVESLRVTWALVLAPIVDPDQSGRNAVARRIARHQKPCAPQTSASGTARRRRPEAWVAERTRDTGRERLEPAPPAWRWKGRPVKIVDGTTVRMPDTPENPAAYPQPPSPKAGLGFPRARMVVLRSRSVGTGLDPAIGRYQGKETGETARFRGRHDCLGPGDVLRADRSDCSYGELAEPIRRGVDGVVRRHQRRRADFRRGRRLGRDDHRVRGVKPAKRPDGMDEASSAGVPDRLERRAVRVRVLVRGFRTKAVVVTRRLDPAPVSRDDRAALDRARWDAELDIRAIQPAMTMEVLRCARPGRVRQAIGAHRLGYHRIRAVLARAVSAHGVLPRQIRFTGAFPTWDALRDELKRAPVEGLGRRWGALLEAMARHRVGDRPDRVEPRARQQRPQQDPV